MDVDSDRTVLTRELMEDRAVEMGELSRFLHDTVAQDLVKLSFFIHELPAGIDVQVAKALIDRCCRDIRTLSSILAPAVLTGLPLYASIEQYVSCFRDETAMTVTTDLDPLPPLAADVELLFGAVLQSCLALTLRCDRGAAVAIRLRERGNTASLHVEIRPSPASALPANCLAGWAVVRERAAALGGEFTVAADSGFLNCTVAGPWFPPHE